MFISPIIEPEGVRSAVTTVTIAALIPAHDLRPESAVVSVDGAVIRPGSSQQQQQRDNYGQDPHHDRHFLEILLYCHPKIFLKTFHLIVNMT